MSFILLYLKLLKYSQITKNKLVITKSTVPVGTGDIIEKMFKKLKRKNFEIISNQEFLEEL